MNNIYIGSNIRKLRLGKELSQIELADIAGVSDKAISFWETGAKMPRMGPLEKISQYFGVPKGVLLDMDIDEYFSNISINGTNFPTTPHEQAVITHYRAMPQVQPMVDRLLGIHNEKYVSFLEAAHSEEGRTDADEADLDSVRLLKKERILREEGSNI